MLEEQKGLEHRLLGRFHSAMLISGASSADIVRFFLTFDENSR